MKNFTAQSNQKSSGNSCQHERRNSATAAARHSGRNPWLAALECDFRHPADGRKWKARCWLKRQIIRALVLIGEDATEQQISRFQKIPRRTVRWGMALLKAQGLVSNVKKFGLYGPMLRQLHPEKLGAYAESCRTSTRESCRVDSSPQRTTPKSAAGAATSGRSPVFAVKTEKPNTRLEKRLSCKLKGNTLKDHVTGMTKQELIGEEWRYEPVLAFFKSVGYKVDLKSPVLGLEFLSCVAITSSRWASADLKPSVLCSKVIDWCQLGHDYWPPDFLAHRDRLVAEGR